MTFLNCKGTGCDFRTSLLLPEKGFTDYSKTDPRHCKTSVIPRENLVSERPAKNSSHGDTLQFRKMTSPVPSREDFRFQKTRGKKKLSGQYFYAGKK